MRRAKTLPRSTAPLVGNVSDTARRVGGLPRRGVRAPREGTSLKNQTRRRRVKATQAAASIPSSHHETPPAAALHPDDDLALPLPAPELLLVEPPELLLVEPASTPPPLLLPDAPESLLGLVPTPPSGFVKLQATPTHVAPWPWHLHV